MKTVALNNKTAVGSFFVLAALVGLYYFRRQGGSFSSLAARGTDAIGAARTWVNKVAPSVGEQIEAFAPKASSKLGSRPKTQSVATSAQI